MVSVSYSSYHWYYLENVNQASLPEALGPEGIASESYSKSRPESHERSIQAAKILEKGLQPFFRQSS